MSSPVNSRQGNTGRSYVWPPTGEVFPSVTTILDAINKPALVGWAAKQAAVYAVQNQKDWAWMRDKSEAITKIAEQYKRTTEASSAIGTHVHECIEADLDHLDPPNPAPEQMRHYEAWKKQYNPEFLLSEVTVYNRTVGYAGTLDIGAVINGLTTLVDVKTGKSLWPEVSLQLAAYANGEFIGAYDKVNDQWCEMPVPKFEAAGVLHLRMTGWRFVSVSIDPEVFTAFRHVNEVWRWQAYGSRSVLGVQSKLATSSPSNEDGAISTTQDGVPTEIPQP